MEKVITKNLDEARKKFPHVEKYLKSIAAERGVPEFYPELGREMKSMKMPNLIYPVGDPIFIHIYKNEFGQVQYYAIEPVMEPEDEKLFERVMDKLIEIAHSLPVPEKLDKIEPILIELLQKVCQVTESGAKAGLSSKVVMTPQQFELIKYFLIRNRIGFHKIDPILKDPYLEDVHCTGVGAIKTVHKIFGLVYTSVIFRDDLELNRYIVEVSERVERPTSDAHSVVDAMMPDGSRANFIYGRDISLEGSSFTLRKFSDVPTSVPQIVNWGTMSAELGAYLWIALENGMNMFICGETASGKTTTLNAICTFIKPDDKVYSVENTPEVKLPHDVWQHLLTREAGKSSDVTYDDLLAAALRSRPNYIIVGEIRGKEGSIAFQAMQTGHPVLSTFHAASPTSMIQRITGHPISVPITFVDNLNLVLIQLAIRLHGSMARRIVSLTEIERYYEPLKKMITRTVFDWNAQDDVHNFRGMFNSYILEQKIAMAQGYADPRKIYDELTLRANIIRRMVEEKIFNYYDVWKITKLYHFGGVKALPFKV
ncbi:hypothetical protein COY28_05140 [Candidatus Woesearchaeota archaeon CG_4_10_14_0_2_um_filter_57_5]|nr:MAG: hypothetical protein AUJ68_00170 [Candidatus Woesearchaeota archaeon CG1_02_57_44]PIZ51166.1 MAG: hypothetical protein COY28_05140 [Candidatus Woesearchaeota archaeon CG_4_10_14_0_2_um_filter_57_5]